MEDTTKNPIDLLLSMLGQIHEYEILNDNILILHKDDEKIYLRYSIGETFSFLKGSAPIKIQVKKGFEIDKDKFMIHLDKIIEEERSGGFMTKKKFCDKIELDSMINILGSDKFDMKSDKIVFTSEYYRISIYPDGKLEHVFTPNFLKIKSLQSVKSIVAYLERDMGNISNTLKNE